jgi:type IV secretory pathway TrbD component
MAELTETGDHVEPSAEELPGPSFWPIVSATGTALTLTGVVIAPPLWIIGLVIVAVGVAGWVWDARRDYLALH